MEIQQEQQVEVSEKGYVGAPPPESETPASTPAADETPKPALSLRDRIAANIDKVQKTKGASDEPKSAAATRGPDGKFQKPATSTAPAAKPAEAPKPAAENAAPAAEGAPVTEPPAYTPNFKFKHAAVKGDPKQAEGEFAEFLKEAVKTPEHEKLVRELYEKAGGLDFIKPQFQKLRNEHGDLATAHRTVLGSIQDLREDVQRGDYDSFFQKLKIPKQNILQWVMDQVSYAEMPPEQRAVVDARQQAEHRAREAERRASMSEESFAEQSRMAKAYALESSLARPDVSSVAQAFDSRVGKSGAFRQLVAQHGEAEWYRSNGTVDLTPEQAIEQVMGLYGLSAQASPMQTPAAPATPVAPQAPAAPTAQAPVAPPAPPKPATTVIPHIAAGANSPAAGKPKPRSIADLKRIRAEMN